MHFLKSNLFIATHHVHKCTDGEILRYKTVPWQYKQQDMKKLQYTYKQQYTHFTQYTHLHNIQ